MTRPVSRSELARLAGVSPAAITKACKGQLRPACVGKRVDLDHPAAVQYLKAKGVSAPAPTDSLGPSKKRSPKPTRDRRTPEAQPDSDRAPRSRSAEEIDDLVHRAADVDGDEDPEPFLDLTLAQIVERFGTKTGFKDWLNARKTIADIREKELKSDETEGRLIERELVKTHVFGAIDAGNRRLLGDSPKTIARRLYALAKSGAPLEEAETVVREIISKQLQPVKTTAARVLRNA